MWIFKGDLNLLDNGYANLDTLFFMAPWVFLFLVPAITMKLFAEEWRSGTMELLLTLPLPGMQIILAKYFAAVILVFFSLLPTLVHYISVYILGSPPGNLDHAAILGSYLGLLFLGGVYAAVGLFISSLTDNQIISFIITVLICFFLYTGFDLISSLNLFAGWDHLIMKLGINEHYISIRRGVVDTRDLVYFLSLIVVFLLLTSLVLLGYRSRNLIKFGITLVIIFLVNFISSSVYHRFDLTSEKRYSISPATKQVLRGLDDIAYVRVYLHGELPSGFTRLKTAIRETLDEFRIYAGENIQYEFIDPVADPDPQIQRNVFSQLVDMGLQPTRAQVVQKDGSTIQKILFPGVVISYNGMEVPVNLLKNNMGVSGELNLHNSIQSLEYEFTIMLRNLSSDTIEKVAFMEGHGEWDAYQVGDITMALAQFYQVDRGRIDGNPGILDGYQAVIIAGPVEPFSEADKFVIDQYIMNGGKVLWLIDPVQVSMDSIFMGSTLALYKPLNLEDQLFRYGVRLNPNLVQDMQCHVIPVNTSLAGTAPDWQLSPWYYYPVISPDNGHVITRALNMLWVRFGSVIDTVGMDPAIEKTFLMETSPYTRVIPVPTQISLRETGIPPQERDFNKSRQPLAVLLEGRFESVFTNRPLPAVNSDGPVPFREGSEPTKMIVISDADLIRNDVQESPDGPVPAPLGFDYFTEQTYGNRDFILNCVNYLTRQTDLMSLRGREFRLRLLDRQRVLEQADTWRWINTLAPILVVILSGLGIRIVRNYRYRKPVPSGAMKE
jgi:ABC-2 type transport system permease protein